MQQQSASTSEQMVVCRGTCWNAVYAPGSESAGLARKMRVVDCCPGFARNEDAGEQRTEDRDRQMDQTRYEY